MREAVKMPDSAVYVLPVRIEWEGMNEQEHSRSRSKSRSSGRFLREVNEFGIWWVTCNCKPPRGSHSIA